jgi:hypothetical protein
MNYHFKKYSELFYYFMAYKIKYPCYDYSKPSSTIVIPESKIYTKVTKVNVLLRWKEYEVEKLRKDLHVIFRFQKMIQ